MVHFSSEKIINCITFSNGGSRVATCSDDGTIIIWRTRDGRSEVRLRGHNCPVIFISFGIILNLLFLFLLLHMMMIMMLVERMNEHKNDELSLTFLLP